MGWGGVGWGGAGGGGAMRRSVVVTSAADSSQKTFWIFPRFPPESSQSGRLGAHTLDCFFSSHNVFLPGALISPDDVANNVDSQSCCRRNKKQNKKVKRC